MAGAAKRRAVNDRKAKNETPSPESQTSASGHSAGQSPVSQSSPPAQYDGNRDPEVPRAAAQAASNGGVSTAQNRNVDLGAAAASVMGGFGAIADLPQRPALTNKTGREIAVKLNTFNVIAFPTKPIYQYDVVIGNGLEKRGLIRSVWECKKIQDRLGNGWIFDGNRLAWSMNEANINEEINMDVERGQTPKPGKKPDIHKVVIRKTKQVDFGSLRNFLEKKLINMNESVLEAINFLDHLMRETPSKRHTAIKRNFFARGTGRTPLGNGVEAFKGVYASIRMVSAGLGQMGTLSVNVDVANTTFWTESQLHIAVGNFLDATDVNRLTTVLNAGSANRSPAMINLRKFRHVRVYDSHRNDPKAKENPYCIESFLNLNARQHKFNMLQDNGQEKEVTTEQYFKQKYNITLQHPLLPVVQMTRKHIVIPMELLTLLENQRYNSKLSDRQTSNMIKFAVTLPDERWKSVEYGLQMLDWDSDPYLQKYGLKISRAPVSAKARLLPNPKVEFAQKKLEDPRTGGRWDLKNKAFHGPHTVPLESWGVSVSPGGRGQGSVSFEQVQNFITNFMNVFAKHGGKIASRDPIILQGTQQPNKDVEVLYNAIGNKFKKNPQLMIFVVPDKDSQRYVRIKRSCDCRYGVVSQVMQAVHVGKNQDQYISNVCMKVNAKLGGYSFKAVGTQTTFKEPTMIIGADVSHAAPGSSAASLASITMSYDRDAIRYAAAVASNGVRVEMITKANIDTMIKPLAQEWVKRVGGGKFPSHIIYMRDGVSEGQYAQVLNQEVNDMRQMFKEGAPNANIKFTVVIASKRHHVRFFPEGNTGDRNKNPLPGTLVESGVTHPFEYDFYLNSHSAIKGTARPIHYHVIKDDAKMGAAVLQNMIYEHSYQYIRSTTPVSLHPAAYYAHLAANRAAAHVDPANVSSDGSHTTPTGQTGDVPALTSMPNTNGIRYTMWYC